MTSHPLRALVAVERPAAVLGSVVAAGLEAGGVAARVCCLGGPVPADLADADLLVLGARTGACRTRDGALVRSWLAALRSPTPHQLAAAFELSTDPTPPDAEGSGSEAARLLSSRGFLLAAAATAFRVNDIDRSPALGEVHRAQRWGLALADATRDALLGVALERAG